MITMKLSNIINNLKMLWSCFKNIFMIFLDNLKQVGRISRILGEMKKDLDKSFFVAKIKKKFCPLILILFKMTKIDDNLFEFELNNI